MLVGPLVVVVVVVLPHTHTFLPSQHWFGPVVVVGHPRVPEAAPPGRQIVRKHTPDAAGQEVGGSQPQGGCVLVGRGVGDDVVLVVVPTRSPMCESSQASQGGPATHDVSYKYIPSDELRDTPFWFSEASKNNHGAGGFAGRKPGPHC